jgi:hypothetical protein
MQRGERTVHASLREAAGGGQALAQADDAAEAVEHAEALVAGRADQQAAIVGAEIEGGEGGRVTALAPRVSGEGGEVTAGGGEEVV